MLLPLTLSIIAAIAFAILLWFLVARLQKFIGEWARAFMEQIYPVGDISLRGRMALLEQQLIQIEQHLNSLNEMAEFAGERLVPNFAQEVRTFKKVQDHERRKKQDEASQEERAQQCRKSLHGKD